MKNKIVLLLILILTSCSGVTMIKPERKVADNVDTSKLYRQDFLKQVTIVKDKMRTGKNDVALIELNKIKEDNLSPVEKATKKNLGGVILFGIKSYEKSALSFEEALTLAKEDPALLAQIHLNLGSSYYKMGQNDRALTVLSQANYKNLQDSEAKKYHQLYAHLSELLGKKEQSISALVYLMGDKKMISDLTSDSRFEKIEEGFFKMTRNERARFLEDFEDEKNLAVAFLAYKEASAAFKEGEKSRVKDFSSWIEKRYGDNEEIMNLVSSLGARTENNSVKVDPRYVGIVLPLSGDLKGLGERALAGLDIALEEVSADETKKYRMEIKDSKGNPASGAFAVKDLVENNNIAVIIGGLTSSEATKEYLEAKKYGVVFISLSKVLLPKEEKNHLLVEIPGSIESQINHLLSQKMLNRIGSRPAIIYPRTEIGEAYANEFWRQAKKNQLDVTGVMSFDTNASDYRDPVKNILGIKYTRERELENELVQTISKLEGNRNVKRLQSLQPQLDFDWVFVPALPREAVQILPNFNFFDAFNLNYVGVQSWRSELMLNEGYRYGNVYFMDEAISSNVTPFTQKFYEKYKKQPNIVETISYDALRIIIDVVESDGSFETRRDLDLALMKKESLRSESGQWFLKDDIWMKDMNTYRIRREGIESANLK